MTGKWNGKKCPVCGKGTLHDEVRKQSVTYRGKEFVADQFGAYCDQCGDGVSYRDQAIEKSWEQFKSAVDRTERVELAAIRKRLGLTQKQAAQLAGGGHNAFSRYERGEAQPVAAVVNLFSLLDRHPELLTEFGIREPAGSCAAGESYRCGSKLQRAGHWFVERSVPIGYQYDGSCSSRIQDRIGRSGSIRLFEGATRTRCVGSREKLEVLNAKARMGSPCPVFLD
jgi:HTH-type transcriptional regulator / antitoxin MqsA